MLRTIVSLWSECACRRVQPSKPSAFAQGMAHKVRCKAKVMERYKVNRKVLAMTDGLGLMQTER